MLGTGSLSVLKMPGCLYVTFNIPDVVLYFIPDFISCLAGDN